MTSITEISSSDAGDGTMYVSIKFEDGTELTVNPYMGTDTVYQVADGKVVHEEVTVL